MKTLAGMVLDWIALGNINPRSVLLNWMELDLDCDIFDTKDIVLTFYDIIDWDDLGLDGLQVT
jgi:hypothetical protein